MTGYHPFLSRLAAKRPIALAACLLQAGTVDEALIGGMSRDQLMSALLNWADSTGLARGQGDFGFIMWAHGIGGGLQAKYGEDAA